MNSIDLCELNFKIKKIKFDLNELDKENKKMQTIVCFHLCIYFFLL